MKEEVRLNQALYSSVMVFDQNRQNSRMENGERVFFTAPRGFETNEDGSRKISYFKWERMGVITDIPKLP